MIDKMIRAFGLFLIIGGAVAAGTGAIHIAPAIGFMLAGPVFLYASRDKPRA